MALGVRHKLLTFVSFANAKATADYDEALAFRHSWHSLPDAAMFANLLHLFHRRPDPGYELAFVKDVRVHRPVPRSRRSERFLAIGWLLIAVKCASMFWLVDRYAMPIDAWWIVAPTLVAAGACTWIYLRRE